jgi:hypothetical protein
VKRILARQEWRSCDGRHVLVTQTSFCTDIMVAAVAT